MKAILIILLLLISLSAAYAAEDDQVSLAVKDPKAMLRLFGDFQKTYSRHYSRSERRLRLQNFNSFVKNADELNRMDEDVQYGITFSADLTAAEANRLRGINQTALFQDTAESATSDDDDDDDDEDEDADEDEDTADLKIANDVRYGPIKDQSPCGSCWAFAGVGLLEGHAYLTTGHYVALSEQEVIDCTEGSGTNGGSLPAGLRQVRDQNHLATEADYPYQRNDGWCNARQHSNALPFRITAVNYIKGDNNLFSALQDAPVAVAMSFPSALNGYKSGVWSDRVGQCAGTPLNHGVVVVAYSFQYWKVRNSWGSNWGEQGYIRFSRRVNNLCRISDSVKTISLQKTSTVEVEE
ncbi:uncharacterized protein LOC134812532 [Bolinopsis microptera]|uniref:uncharacterized protein LOC134812532 n=1 Tax=Bolinopsis microptera TaxID=2820187 RepID=UPI003079EDAC